MAYIDDYHLRSKGIGRAIAMVGLDLSDRQGRVVLQILTINTQEHTKSYVIIATTRWSPIGRVSHSENQGLVL